MMSCLVIPAGQTVDDTSWIVRDGKALSWADVAADNRVAVADAEWLAENGIDPSGGYGIFEEGRPFTVVGPPGLSLGDAFARIAAIAVRLEAKGVFVKQDTADIGAVKADVASLSVGVI